MLDRSKRKDIRLNGYRSNPVQFSLSEICPNPEQFYRVHHGLANFYTSKVGSVPIVVKVSRSSAPWFYSFVIFVPDICLRNPANFLPAQIDQVSGNIIGIRGGPAGKVLSKRRRSTSIRDTRLWNGFRLVLCDPTSAEIDRGRIPPA